MNEQELKAQLDELKSNLERAATEKTKAEVAAQIKSVEKQIEDLKASIPSTKNLEEGITEIKAWQVKKDEADKANQEALDRLIADSKQIKDNTQKGKSFMENFASEVEKNFDSIAKVKKGQPFRMEVKTVGDMTLGSNLTGDSVATYSGRQAIIPSQKINFRDLIPVVHSDTGLYVQYREGAGEGTIGVQTEGADKDQRDYDFTEVKVVNDYIAGFTRFSKQMARSLPWMQSTLPRLLLRDFYKKENSVFWDAVVAAATGSTTTSETADIKQIMDYLAALSDADFAPSYIIMNNESVARINKSLLDTGNYQGAGGVLSLSNGALQVNGVPVIPASWAASDKVLIFDRDYLERVEVESVVVEFFEQDYKNVQQNKITARIECYEDINLMLPQSATYADLGNES
jgi:HK97 family phage major capsid protein